MKQRSISSASHKEAFDFFREFYNHRLNAVADCERAFQLATCDFFNKFGYKPYDVFEDYLAELFHVNNGFQLFERYG